MLANPHWNAPSFSSFEAWLETQDPRETYQYSNSCDCACARYLKHVGKYEPKWLSNAVCDDTIFTMNRLAAGHFPDEAPTLGQFEFGSLLARVRRHRQLAAV